jgi:hypothetical protein
MTGAIALQVPHKKAKNSMNWTLPASSLTVSGSVAFNSTGVCVLGGLVGVAEPFGNGAVGVPDTTGELAPTVGEGDGELAGAGVDVVPGSGYG